MNLASCNLVVYPLNYSMPIASISLQHLSSAFNRYCVLMPGKWLTIYLMFDFQESAKRQRISANLNIILYIGLGTMAIGLIITFVGIGEKGFKTTQLQ